MPCWEPLGGPGSRAGITKAASYLWDSWMSEYTLTLFSSYFYCFQKTSESPSVNSSRVLRAFILKNTFTATLPGNSYFSTFCFPIHPQSQATIPQPLPSAHWITLSLAQLISLPYRLGWKEPLFHLAWKEGGSWGRDAEEYFGRGCRGPAHQ